MLDVDLARYLAAAGLTWRPASGDRFVIADRGMDAQVFVVSEMVVEAEVLAGGGVLKFNGTTEWALDSVEQDGTLWLPREDQLRTALGAAFVRLERTEAGWAVTTDGPHGPAVSECADPEDLRHRPARPARLRLTRKPLAPHHGGGARWAHERADERRAHRGHRAGRAATPVP